MSPIEGASSAVGSGRIYPSGFAHVSLFIEILGNQELYYN
jgi:hypothetical protein